MTDENTDSDIVKAQVRAKALWADKIEAICVQTWSELNGDIVWRQLMPEEKAHFRATLMKAYLKIKEAGEVLDKAIGR